MQLHHAHGRTIDTFVMHEADDVRDRVAVHVSSLQAVLHGQALSDLQPQPSDVLLPSIGCAIRYALHVVQHLALVRVLVCETGWRDEHAALTGQFF